MSLISLAINALISAGKTVTFKFLPWVGMLALTSLVRPVLEDAHQCYLDRCRWQRRWRELTESLDVQLVTSSIVNREHVPVSYILIRNSSKTPIFELALGVEAKCGKLSHVESVIVPLVEPGRIYKALLPQIPMEELWATENGIFSRYDSIEVYPRAFIQEELMLSFAPKGMPLQPSHFDFLNGECILWRGVRYNTKAIKDEVTEGQLRVANIPSHRYGLYGQGASSLLRAALRERMYGAIPIVFIVGIYGSRPIQRLKIWTLLICRRKRLVFELEEGMEKATEYVLNRGRGVRPIRKMPIYAADQAAFRDDSPA